MARGWIYAYVNAAHPGLVKIGHTTRDVDARVQEQVTAGNPLDHYVVAKYEVFDSEKAEGIVKDHLRYAVFDPRNPRKEWFRVSVEKAIQALSAAAEEFPVSTSLEASGATAPSSEEPVVLIAGVGSDGRATLPEGTFDVPPAPESAKPFQALGKVYWSLGLCVYSVRDQSQPLEDARILVNHFAAQRARAEQEAGVRKRAQLEQMVQATRDMERARTDWTGPRSGYSMRRVPAQEFWMKDAGPSAESGKWGKQLVTLTREYWIGTYPVTQALWQAVTGSNPSEYRDANAPVTGVCWFEAATFANRLSERDGLTPAYRIEPKEIGWLARLALEKGEVTEGANGYRLPTEAEWECAARANQSFTFSGSHNLAEVGWYSENSGGHPHRVGEKKPNGYGLHDMSGNVAEWCWDWHGMYKYADGDAPIIDPVGRGGRHNTRVPEPTPLGDWKRAIGSGIYDDWAKVIRGGSWWSHEIVAKVGGREELDPHRKVSWLGVRLVRFA